MKDSGIYTRRQLALFGDAAGYDDGWIRRAQRAGDLEPLRRGWFAARNHDASAAAAVADGGVLTCVDALEFHDLWIPPGHRDRLHLRRSANLTGKNTACRPPRGALRSARQAVDSVPVALHYAVGCLRPDEWIAVADSYLNTARLDAGELETAMGPAIGPSVRRLLTRTEPRSQSGTESIVRVRLRSEGFDVVVQPPIDGVGHTDLRIGMLLLECDSILHHASRHDYERDHHRDRRAVVDGWIVMRLTYDDVLYGWAGVLDDIRTITRADRHRARSARSRALLHKSVRRSIVEGSLPSDLDQRPDSGGDGA